MHAFIALLGIAYAVVIDHSLHAGRVLSLGLAQPTGADVVASCVKGGATCQLVGCTDVAGWFKCVKSWVHLPVWLRVTCICIVLLVRLHRVAQAVSCVVLLTMKHTRVLSCCRAELLATRL